MYFLGTDKEKQMSIELTGEEEIIQYMLENYPLEKALKKFQKYPKRSKNLINLLRTIAEQDKNNRGLIMAVSCDGIPVGVENIEFFSIDQKFNFHKAGGEDCTYVMAFTSKEHFRKFDDTSGIVMFIGDIFGIVECKGDIDGIVFNAGKEEVVLEKEFIRAVLWIIDHSPETE